MIGRKEWLRMRKNTKYGKRKDSVRGPKGVLVVRIEGN